MRRTKLLSLCGSVIIASLIGLVTVCADAQTATPPQTPPGQQPQDKPRVYVTDSQSWEIRGGWSVSGDGSGSISGGGYEAGGARPQTVEIIKTFNQRCPQVIVTNNVQKADFAVTLDHEGGKGNGVLSRALAHKDKVVVFNRDGDAIFSDSTRELGNSVKNACNAILSSPGKK
jgi:hypothetical protein